MHKCLSGLRSSLPSDYTHCNILTNTITTNLTQETYIAFSCFPCCCDKCGSSEMHIKGHLTFSRIQNARLDFGRECYCGGLLFSMCGGTKQVESVKLY